MGKHLNIADEMTNEARPVIAITVGILFTIMGVVTLPYAMSFVRNAETADGVITEDLGHRRGWIQFTASDGDTYGFRAHMGEANVGDHVEVTYRGDAPWREGSTKGVLGACVFPLTGFGFGLLGFVLGVSPLILQRRRARARRR